MNDEFQERTYRQLVRGHLPSMRVSVQETDLSVHASGIDSGLVKEAVIEHRGYIENYIQNHPDFSRALLPWPEDPLAPPVVQEMIHAGKRANVGPMAAVAGAVAQSVGRFLLSHTDEVIIENGGDIFLKTRRDLSIGIYAGHSPLSLKVGLKIASVQTPISVCTSSGTVGHSLSYGKADAVCVLSKSCALADACATAIGNQINTPDDIEPAIQKGRVIPGVLGILVIAEDKMGAWGQIAMTAMGIAADNPVL